MPQGPLPTQVSTWDQPRRGSCVNAPGQPSSAPLQCRAGLGGTCVFLWALARPSTHACSSSLDSTLLCWLFLLFSLFFYLLLFRITSQSICTQALVPGLLQTIPPHTSHSTLIRMQAETRQQADLMLPLSWGWCGPSVPPFLRSISSWKRPYFSVSSLVYILAKKVYSVLENQLHGVPHPPDSSQTLSPQFLQACPHSGVLSARAH